MQHGAGTMIRLRIFIGLSSALQGLGGFLFDFDTGVAWLVREQRDGWQWSAALIGAGLLMAWSAARQSAGETRRRCRVIAAFLLAVVWAAVFFNSLEPSPDTVTLTSPLYVWFCFWAWLAEATHHRNRILEEKAR